MEEGKIIIVPKARPAVDFASNLLVIPKDDVDEYVKEIDKHHVDYIRRIAFAIRTNRYECTLYFVGNDDAVCDGVLEERNNYGSHYSFVCNDGRVLRELTNFRVENCTSE